MRATASPSTALAVTGLMTAGALALASPAAAAPVVETVDRTFVNGFLSEQCGVEVVQHLWGSSRTVEQGTRTSTGFRFRSTLSAGDAVVDSRAFGPTITQVQPDGSLVVTQLGVTMRNLPGSGTAGPFAGRTVTTVVLDEAGEVVSETMTSETGLRQGLAELCAALTGGA